MSTVSASWFADLLSTSHFLQRYPHHAALLATCDAMHTDQVATMAVASHRQVNNTELTRLYVNAEYFTANPQFFAGVLLHELHHIAYGHLSLDNLHHVENPTLMEVAMEFSANEGIQEPAPAGWQWEAFRHLGLCAGQSTWRRYELLLEATAQGRLQILTESQLDALMPGWRRKMTTPHRSGPQLLVFPEQRSLLPWRNKPRVHSVNGHDEHRPGRRASRGDRGLGDALDRRSQDARAQTWGNRFALGYPTDPEQLREWQLRIRAHLRGEAGGSGGSGSGGSGSGGATVAKELARPLAWTDAPTPTMAWPRVLRSLLRVRRTVHPNYLRPNRRFPDRIGELPGRSRSAPRPELLLGIDTSASMTTGMLSLIRDEVQRLARFARITIAECDAAVQRVYRSPNQEMAVGGGDTDFHPFFSLAAEQSRHFDGVVYFTDGKGPWPTQAPAIPALWVLTNHDAFDCPWGLCVRMPT